MAVILPFDPDWQDMSNHVVHFTKPSPGKTDYDNMLNICGTRRLLAANVFGIAKSKAVHPESQKAVCFSEIPLHQLKRLAAKRGDYAIGFTKALLISRGGGPVLYAYKGTPHHLAIQKMIGSAGSNPSDPVWKVTPFIEAPGQYKSPYFFEWEREWRHVGDLAFEPSDAAFLFIPETLHVAARHFFENARKENIGPAYLCPYLDISWSDEKIREALSQ